MQTIQETFKKIQDHGSDDILYALFKAINWNLFNNHEFYSVTMRFSCWKLWHCFSHYSVYKLQTLEPEPYSFLQQILWHFKYSPYPSYVPMSCLACKLSLMFVRGYVFLLWSEYHVPTLVKVRDVLQRLWVLNHLSFSNVYCLRASSPYIIVFHCCFSTLSMLSV